MKKNEDPKKLFERIKAVDTTRNTKTKKMQESDKMAIALSQAPKEFQSFLTTESRVEKDALTMTNF